MAVPGPWIQGPDQPFDVSSAKTGARMWSRNARAATGTVTDAQWADAINLPTSSYPPADESNSVPASMYGEVDIIGPALWQHAMTFARYTVSPPSSTPSTSDPEFEPPWDPDSIGIEWEPGDPTQTGEVGVETATYRSGTFGVTPARLYGVEDGANFPAGTDYPNLWPTWKFRQWTTSPTTLLRGLYPSLSVTLTAALWYQYGGEAATPSGSNGIATARFEYESNGNQPPAQFFRYWRPPRFRYLYERGGMWNTRQRQTATGNAGGHPVRQRSNGNTTGAWPLRQRQTGI